MPSNKPPRWIKESIPKAHQAPGYPDNHRFMPVEKTINGKLKWSCPIVGCASKTEFAVTTKADYNSSRAYDKHLKSNHSNCIDVSKVLLFDHLLFDLRHRVLICQESQVTILQGTFQQHATECTSCRNLSYVPRCELAKGLDNDDVPILGLNQMNGLHCLECEKITQNTHKHSDTVPCTFQVVHYPNDKPFNRIYGSQPRPRPLYHVATVEPSQCAFDYATSTEIPSFVKDHQLESFEHESMCGKPRSQAEHLATELANIYFLTAYLGLMGSNYPQFRSQLTMSNDPNGDPFDVVTSASVVQSYMNSFASIILILFRNRRISPPPLGRPAASITKAFSMKIYDNLGSLEEARLMTKELTQQTLLYVRPNTKRPRRIIREDEDISTISCDRLELLRELNAQTLEFESPFNDILNNIHLIFCALLLEVNSPQPTLKSVVGYTLAYGRVIYEGGSTSLDVNEAEKIVAGVLYSMRLVVWQQLIQKGYRSGLSFWTHAIQNSINAKHIASIYRDVVLEREKTNGYTAVWDSLEKQAISFDGGNISIYAIRAGLKSFVESTHRQLQKLLFGLRAGIHHKDNIGVRMAGYSFFRDDGLLYKHIMESEDSMTKTMKKAIIEKDSKFVRQYCDSAHAFVLQLLILIRLTTTGAPRETEVEAWTYRNDGTLRSFGIQHDLGFLVSRYQKNRFGRNISFATREFQTMLFFPKSITHFLLHYLALVRPLVAKLAEDVLQENVFKYFDYVISSNYNYFCESHVLLRLHVTLTARHFKQHIGFNAWRHIVELVYQDLTEILVIAAAREGLSTSLGHLASTSAESYARNPHKRPDVKARQADTDRALSILWHKFLELDSDPYEIYYPQSKTSKEPTTHIEDKCVVPYNQAKIVLSQVSELGKESFLSQHQLDLACLWQSSTSFIGVLGRQQGKSFLVQIFARAGPSLVISNDTKASLENAIFCSPGKAMDFMRKIRSGNFRSIIIDDADITIGAINARFWENECPFYILANDFPPCLTNKLKLLTKSPIGIIRAPDRKNYVQYRVISSADIWALTNALLTLIDGVPSKEIIIHIPDETYRAQVEIATQGEIKIVIPGELLSAANEVTHVIHWNHFDSLVYFESCVSLASPTSVKSTVLFFENSKRHPSNTVHMEDFLAAQSYLNSKCCRRKIIGLFMDDMEEDCFGIPGGNYQRCDFCSHDVTETTGNCSYSVMLRICNRARSPSFCFLGQTCTDPKTCLGQYETVLQLSRKYVNSHFIDQAVVWCWLEWTMEHYELREDIKTETSKVVKEVMTGSKDLESAFALECTSQYPKLVAAAIKLSYNLIQSPPMDDEDYFFSAEFDIFSSV